MDNIFSRKLKQLRRARGLSCRQLSVDCNLSDTCIAKIESQGMKREVSIITAMKIAEGLGVDIRELIYE